MARAAVLALVTACWSGKPAVAPEAFAIPARLRTCSIDPPRRTEQQLVVRRWLGRIGERSWLVASAGPRLVLVAIFNGELVQTPLPFDTLRADHVTGTKLWLAGTVETKTLLVEIDLAGEPRIAPPLEWDIAPLAAVDALAVSADRILLAEHTINQLAFQLFDRGPIPTSVRPGDSRPTSVRPGDSRPIERRTIGPVVTVKSSDPLAPGMRCTGDRCFVVAIAGAGPTRRAFVDRFAPDGSTEHEVLADDRIASLQTATLGERTIVVWTSVERSGLFARGLDPGGRPDTRRTVLAGLPAAPIVFEVLPASPPRIAVRGGDDRWVVGAIDVDGRRIDDPRPVPFDRDATAFTGAAMPDGILAAGFWSRVEYHGGFHTWSAKATAAFLPATRDAEPPIEVLPKRTGDGRAGMAAFPLVAPGEAAVLVVPQGPEAPAGGELFNLRGVCPATAGSAPVRTPR
ncbi:MAG: hypothetical protein ABI867_30740 [Kofleriaceae bacterium]